MQKYVEAKFSSLFPARIKLYKLLGAIRAECRECGAYGNSSIIQSDQNIKVHLQEAIIALDNCEHLFNKESLSCEHKQSDHYVIYKFEHQYINWYKNEMFFDYFIWDETSFYAYMSEKEEMLSKGFKRKRYVNYVCDGYSEDLLRYDI